MPKDLKLLAFTPRVKSVIDQVLNQGGFRVGDDIHRPGRNTLDNTSVGGEGRQSYNGAFKLQTILTNSGQSYTLRIVDGSTYSPQTQTSKPMPCKVNGKQFWLSPKTYSKIDKSVHVWLKYEVESQTVEIITNTDPMLHDTDDHAYYLLGSVYFDKGKAPRVAQHHLTGTAIFWHSVTCDLY